MKGKKYGGRKAGTPNKQTKQIRERIDMLLEDQWETLLTDIDALTGKERIDTFIKLLEYSLPKLNRTEIRDVTKIEELLAMNSTERRARMIEIKENLKIA